jgi:hypothetical protein
MTITDYDDISVRLQVYAYDSWRTNPDGSVTHEWEGNGESGEETFVDHPFAHCFGGIAARVMDPKGDEPWFYLSFADGDLPDGQQFLGGAYVQAFNEGAAVGRSHKLGINPGGEVRILGPLPAEQLDANVPAADRERLLTREELGG